MSQFNAPVRRSGGEVNVYTGLLVVAFLVLGSGVFLLASRNMTHSASGANANDGGPFKIVQAR
ncbi:MAG: hypothetical protein KDA25_04570 [Phycisphaerales bacterium]|nr:hypothetical protein [Phycisphaerales bacterium]